MNARSVTTKPPELHRRWRRLMSASFAVLVIALGAGGIVVIATNAPPDQVVSRSLLEALIVGLPVLTGLYAIRSPHTAGFGFLIMGAGLVWSLTSLGESSDSLPYSVGRVSAWAIFPLLVYLMLTFPGGRIARALDRRLFGAVCVLVIVLYAGSALLVEAYPTHTPWASCDAHCPPNAFLVLDSQPALMEDVVRPLREAIAVALLTGVSVSLALRWRIAGPVRGRTVAPVLVASIASVASLIVYLVVRRATSNGELTTSLGLIWALSIPGLAAGFLVGLLRRSMTLGHTLSRLSPALTEGTEPRELRARLAATLDDPRLDVLARDGTRDRWRDSSGRTTSLAEAAERGLAVTMIEDESGPVGALVHDPALDEDEELVAAVCAIVLASFRNAQLVSRLASSLSDLEESRKRIARAADLERSRIERDLHDGAQQRLIGLRIKLSLAEELSADDPADGAKAFHQLGTDVELALDELRSLAHGVYPSLLSDRGLADAVRGMASDVPLPMHLAISGLSRQPPEVETAVYFTCLEAAQNACKHARGATGLWVSLRQADRLRFEVHDDGAGFVPPAGAFSGGLRNMRDRIEAVGGRLTIDSAPGRGTRISGAIPLA
ncbi:sensor histidine kinase [Candidatus Solirubrobacter pratensis]|uniref:sensor histidine kinase n=1 Tax=Candidatus Solirubrobacter pratensis TaxID=1298857 RepID=UPI00040C7E1C|nr:histidine kinase [Candidatus Solirubrobacter pratensis]